MRTGVLLTTAALLALPACSGGTNGTSGASPPCRDVTVTVDEVRGDVNDTFLRAVVRDDSGPLAGETVLFRISEEAGGEPVWTIGTSRTGQDGAAYADLGTAVLGGAGIEAGVVKARAVDAYLTRRRRSGSCVTRGSAAFAPSVTTAAKPMTAAGTPAALRALLEEFVASVPDEGTTVSRLPNGSSGCRMLRAAANDARRHPRWFGASARRAQDALTEAATTCVTSPWRAAAAVRRLLGEWSVPS